MQYLHTVFYAALVWMLSAGTVFAATESPDKVAEAATSQVIQLLKDKRDIYSKSEAVFFQDVERVIDPVIAFDEIARGVMGKYAHRSSDAQIKEFTRVFRSGLIHFYSKAVLTFDTSQLSLGPVEPVPAQMLKDYETGKSRSVPVNLKVRSKDQEYSMSYSMMMKDALGRYAILLLKVLILVFSFVTSLAKR